MDEIRLYVTTLDRFIEESKEMARRLDAGDRTPMPAMHGFVSADMLWALLTPNRWRLLRSLRKAGPSSIRALSKALGRDYRGVHADVMALLDAGLIEKNEAGKVLVPWAKIVAEMDFEAAA